MGGVVRAFYYYSLNVKTGQDEGPLRGEDPLADVAEIIGI